MRIKPRIHERHELSDGTVIFIQEVKTPNRATGYIYTEVYPEITETPMFFPCQSYDSAMAMVEITLKNDVLESDDCCDWQYTPLYKDQI